MQPAAGAQAAAAFAIVRGLEVFNRVFVFARRQARDVWLRLHQAGVDVGQRQRRDHNVI